MTTTATPAPTVPPVARSQSLLVAMTTTMILLVLDSSIGGVLLPSITGDLHLSHAQQGWLIASYLLALAALLPAGGRVVDRIGPVTGFRIGIAGFLAGSIAIGLAFGPAMLIAGRVVAGAAAALLMPATLSVLTTGFAEAERPRAMAIYTGVGQAFGIVGPAFGGLCAQLLDWRAAFLVNIPVGLVGLALVRRAAPPNPCHATASGRALLDFRLLRIPAFAAASLLLWALGFAMTLATVYSAVAVQVTLHLSPTEGGAALLPLVIPLLITTRRLTRRGAAVDLRRVAVGGTLLLALGCFGLGLGLAATQLPLVMVAMVPTGVGIALLLSPMTTAALAAVPVDKRGQAGGLVSSGRQLGSVAGIGAMSVLVATAGEHVGTAIAFAFAAAVLLAAAGTVRHLSRT